MSDRTYCAISATLFTVVGLAHLVRAASSVTLSVGGAELPMWPSWCAVVVLAVLAVDGFRRAAR